MRIPLANWYARSLWFAFPGCVPDPTAAELASTNITSVDGRWGYYPGQDPATGSDLPTATIAGNDLVITGGPIIAMPILVITATMTVANRITGLPDTCTYHGNVWAEPDVSTAIAAAPQSVNAGEPTAITVDLTGVGGGMHTSSSPEPTPTLENCAAALQSGDVDNDKWLNDTENGIFATDQHETWRYRCDILLHRDSILAVGGDQGVGTGWTASGACDTTGSVLSGTASTGCRVFDGAGADYPVGHQYDVVFGSVTDAYDQLRASHPLLSSTLGLRVRGSTSFVDVDSVLSLTKTGSTTEVDATSGTDVTYSFQVTATGADDIFDVKVVDDKCSPTPVETAWYAHRTADWTLEYITDGSQPQSWLVLVTNSGDTNRDGLLNGTGSGIAPETWNFTCTSANVTTELTNVAYATSGSRDRWCASPFERDGTSPMTYSTYSNWNRRFTADDMVNVLRYSTGSAPQCTRDIAPQLPEFGSASSPPATWTVRPAMAPTSTTSSTTTTTTPVVSTTSPSTTIAPSSTTSTTSTSTTIGVKANPNGVKGLDDSRNLAITGVATYLILITASVAFCIGASLRWKQRRG